MGQNTLIVGIVLLVVGIGIGYAVWGNDPTIPIGTHMMPSGSMMSQNIDQHFITQMIPHHEGAIAMAKVALERSKRPEILSLANGIIEAQEREISDMSSWYQSWFGSAPPQGGMGMMRPSDERGSTEAVEERRRRDTELSKVNVQPNVHMGGMEGDLGVLESVPGAEFDREFLEQMIPHHEMAIVMAQMLQAATERAEMRTLADNIITSQSREIEMMRGWLTSWYE